MSIRKYYPELTEYSRVRAVTALLPKGGSSHLLHLVCTRDKPTSENPSQVLCKTCTVCVGTRQERCNSSAHQSLAFQSGMALHMRLFPGT